MSDITRRTLLQSAAALTTTPGAGAQSPPQLAPPKLKISIFCKNVEFLEGEDLAKGAAEIGVEGIDLAVRKGGHVEPERVKQDLPPLVALIRQHGLEVPMLTTD